MICDRFEQMVTADDVPCNVVGELASALGWRVSRRSVWFRFDSIMKGECCGL
jgi:hypothetical protein